MGDARRQKLRCNSYRLEPRCTRQTIEIVGLPEASKLRITGELQKYWATLDPIPSKRLHKLIDTAKAGGGGVVVNLIDSHAVIPPADLIAKVVSKIPDLPATATAEVNEILENYDPETEIVAFSCVPPQLPHAISRLLSEYMVLYATTYQYSFVNIYH
jgi:hypothetical protein